MTNIGAKKYFSQRVQSKIVETGNPIRKEIVQTDKITGINKLRLSLNKKTLFIMGGSQGSETINNAFSESAEKLLKNDHLQIIIITGKNNYEDFIDKNKDIIDNYSERLKVMPYLNNIEWAYAAADLIIYRAGATGLAEITGCGLPAILVPYPYSAEGHQKYNAEFMEKNDAAVMVEDMHFKGEKLYSLVNNIIFNDNRLKEMSKNSKKLANINASENIADIIEQKAGE
ncbi:MAG: UDP-N-acetylglucosamine--N-acetylmuramyl-(pentapeptide) pyrophosphoryl-undecaprenol N-acetylglucosamine transferase [Halanaerobiales bacterium]|nr:UDP-N-acetylglucosamine--N-acetylmuramyl-(pentapeptide) pyrophosphoryl-undecaprenol N-acetylglucosamine transferase [Halanaerobiales bacterium]